MSADIDIQVAQKDQVLSVPYQAVEREEGRETVEILTDQGGVEARTVKTGLRGDDGEVEILEGLREGERIIVLKNED
jgi:macrolide-specific efflux system membrane fusion protein